MELLIWRALRQGIGWQRILNSKIVGGIDYQWQMQSDGDLSIGNAPSAEITLVSNDYDAFQTGDLFRVSVRVDSTEEFTEIGYFIVYSVTETTYGKYEVKAYDRMCKFNVNIDEFLSDTIPEEGIYLWDLFTALCLHCGVMYKTEVQTIPNAYFVIKPFAASGVTGRNLLSWMAEARGCNVMAYRNGQIGFKRYYHPSREYVEYDKTKYKSIDMAKFDCPPIDKVISMLSDGDVGITAGTGDNILKIIGNPLLYVDDVARIQTAVTNIYDVVSKVNPYDPYTYTPATFELVRNGVELELGDLITAVSPSNDQKELPVMSLQYNTSGVKVASYGNKTRNTVVQNRNMEYASLTGKYNSLKTTVDATVSEVGTLSGNVSTLTQTVSGLSTRVTNAEGDISTLEQTATGLQTQVNGKVGNTEVISKINQSAEQVTISASKVNLNGYLTITAGDSRYDASGAAATAQSTAISTAASDATTKANNAASSAVTTVNNGLSAGTTTINGGCITTGTVSAERIGAGSFTMTGGSINVTAGSSTENKISLNYSNYTSKMNPSYLVIEDTTGSTSGHRVMYGAQGVDMMNYSEGTSVHINPGAIVFGDGTALFDYAPDNEDKLLETTGTSWTNINFYLPKAYRAFELQLTAQDNSSGTPRTFASTHIPAKNAWREASSFPSDPGSIYADSWVYFGQAGLAGQAAFVKVGNSYRIYGRTHGGDTRLYIWGVR